MKMGVVGRGQTGKAVITVLGERVGEIFSTANPLEPSKLKGLQALIVFVPALAFQSILPALLESRLPVICGTTGYSWDDGFSEELKRRNLTWIAGSNFSPGMNFMFVLADLIKRNAEFLGNPDLRIHDLHHVHKKDSPSGTALTLQRRLGSDIPIFSEREGSHPGLHEIILSSPLETMTFKHEAMSRLAFAEGAVYAADQLLPVLKPGLHFFETLMKEKIC